MTAYRRERNPLLRGIGPALVGQIACHDWRDATDPGDARALVVLSVAVPASYGPAPWRIVMEPYGHRSCDYRVRVLPVPPSAPAPEPVPSASERTWYGDYLWSHAAYRGGAICAGDAGATASDIWATHEGQGNVSWERIQERHGVTELAMLAALLYAAARVGGSHGEYTVMALLASMQRRYDSGVCEAVANAVQAANRRTPTPPNSN